MSKKTFYDREFKPVKFNYPQEEIRFWLEVVGKTKSVRFEPKLKEILKKKK